MAQAATRRAAELSDAELVQMARRGDSAALGAVLDRHRVSLFARALGCLGERETAADAVQEAFVVAMLRLDQLRDPAKVGGWLHVIVRSVCAMQLRHGHREVPVPMRGQDELRRWCEQDLTDRVGYRLADVTSGAGMTIVEAEFVNPPDDPSHCPPAVTQVLLHDGRDEVHRMYGYFAPREDDATPDDE